MTLTENIPETLAAPTLLPPSLVQSVLRPPPHSLTDARAELIFLNNGQLLFCSREHGVHTAKFVHSEDVKRAFHPIVSDSGWLPPDLVRWGHGNGKEWVVLFKSGRLYNLTLVTPEREQQVIRVPLPSVVILTVDHDLYVWAVKTPTFNPDTAPFQLPLPNVAQNGHVCFGANKHVPATLQTAQNVWETWITGAFTGEACTQKSKRYPDDVRDRLRALEGKEKYPQSDLVPCQSAYRNNIAAVIDYHLQTK